MKNPSFENGWETLPPTGNAGWLQNQRPNDWGLTILPPGTELWDSPDKVTGEPECVHKLASQLPPNEQPGGSDPLILDGETVYKVFHSGAAYGIELRQVVEGLKPGTQATAVVKIRVHDHLGTDPYGAEFRMISNGKGQWWHKDVGQLVNFKWVERRHTRTIGDNGLFELIIQLKTKYPLPVDFFLDAFEFIGEFVTDPDPDPPPDPEPTPDCYGLPREDYRRVVNVLPSGATLEQAVEVFKQRWQAGRETVTGSYDDAGIGDLSDKTAVLWGLPLERHAEFLAWYQEHYPGTKVEFENLPFSDPFAGLKFGQPLSTIWETVKGGEFDAPRDYSEFPGGKLNDKHEGVDAAPSVSTPAYTLNVWPGIVVYTGYSAGYGNNVIVQHEINGVQFTTRRAHLSSILVNNGQSLTKGAEIGVCGSTGNSTGRHDHLTMQSDQYGMDGYIVPKVVNPTRFYPESQTIPPPDEYVGPAVTFVPGVDQPASDWRWPQAKAVFDVTGLAAKFHVGGNNHEWYAAYKNDTFNLARILVAPDFTGDLYNETANNVAQWFSMGVRDFEVLNEPNIEGMGFRWNNGMEFGIVFRDYCKKLKLNFIGIRLWFPGMSPGFGAQYAFIDAAASVGAFDYIYGMCEHVYTGIVDNQQAAVDQMTAEVMQFRAKYALKRPLAVTEFSVNRPASASYKAAVYKAFFDQLGQIEGIQAAYSFNADWGDSDPNQEGWLKNGIHTAYNAL